MGGLGWWPDRRARLRRNPEVSIEELFSERVFCGTGCVCMNGVRSLQLNRACQPA